MASTKFAMAALGLKIACALAMVSASGILLFFETTSWVGDATQITPTLGLFG